MSCTSCLCGKALTQGLGLLNRLEDRLAGAHEIYSTIVLAQKGRSVKDMMKGNGLKDSLLQLQQLMKVETISKQVI